MTGLQTSEHIERREPVSDETTPLLPNAPSASTTDPAVAASTVEETNEDETPLPIVQIVLLCYARIVEPIAFFGILPFINQMVQQNGSLDESGVGFYSGLIESLFSLTQMCVMIFWGRVSDRVGRKPVLVASLLGVAITTALFGLAKTIWQMILFRCLAGVFAGTIVTIRTMISELSTPNTQARAFSYFMFANNMGIFLGPLIGGALADPAGQYGGFFKNVEFLLQFPYALSTFVTGFLGLTASVITAIFVKETLPSKVKASPESANSKSADMSLSTWQLLRHPGVAKVLSIYSHVMMIAYAYTAVVPVFWFTSVKLGGFQFTPIQISLFMALTGASQALWTLLIFPPLHRRVGTGWVLKSCSVAYIFFFACNPLLNLLLRHAENDYAHWTRTLFWVVGPPLLCVGVGISMSFTAIQLALNDISPSKSTLGTLNGIALSLSSGVRAFSPALYTSLFAVGVQHQILGGYLIWFIFILLAIGFVALAWSMPAKAEGRPKRTTAAGS